MWVILELTEILCLLLCSGVSLTVAVEKTPREMPLFFRQAVAEQSHTQVEKVYQLAKAGGLTDNGSPEARAFTVSRLAAGSQMLLNLWYTAWLDSSQPPTPPKYE